MPSRVNKKEESAVASLDETDQHLNKMDPVLANQNSSGAFNIGVGKDTVDDGMIEGTLGSIARDAPLELDSKPEL